MYREPLWMFFERLLRNRPTQQLLSTDSTCVKLLEDSWMLFAAWYRRDKFHINTVQIWAFPLLLYNLHINSYLIRLICFKRSHQKSTIAYIGSDGINCKHTRASSNKTHRKITQRVCLGLVKFNIAYKREYREKNFYIIFNCHVPISVMVETLFYVIVRLRNKNYVYAKFPISLYTY